jgi:hypothetical protein
MPATFKHIEHRTPEYIGQLWLKVWDLRDQLPWGLGKDAAEFVRLMQAPRMTSYEVGDFQGVVFFTNIREAPLPDDEPGAMVHILVWDTIYLYRNTKMFRELLKDFFRRYNVRRVMGEIPAGVRLNKFLSKGIGFNEVGTLRQRVPRNDGEWEDAVIVDILRDDLEVRYGVLDSDSSNDWGAGVERRAVEVR